MLTVGVRWWAAGRRVPNPIATRYVDDYVVGNSLGIVPRNPILHPPSCHPQTFSLFKLGRNRARAQAGWDGSVKAPPDQTCASPYQYCTASDRRCQPPATNCSSQPSMAGNSEKGPPLLQIDPNWYVIHLTAHVRVQEGSWAERFS